MKMKIRKQLMLWLVSVLLLPIGLSAQETETLEQMIERGMNRAVTQSLFLAKTLESMPDLLPRTYENDALQTIRYDHWVSGFFPGVLWQLYEYTEDKELRRYAEMMTARVEPAKKMTVTHDLGFMLYCSFGQGYRLTGNQHYLDVINEGTQSLLTRWNPKLDVIKSWESGGNWQYPVIIDNMMNLEMLCFMTREFSDRHYVRIAEKHAQTTIKNHYRPDYVAIMSFPTTPSAVNLMLNKRHKAGRIIVHGHADRLGGFMVTQ